MTYKLVIAGSRSFADDNCNQLVRDAMNATRFSYPWNGEIVSGGADGIDQAAERFARIHRDMDFKEFPPDYDLYYSDVAPKMRNQEMAQYGDKLLAIWDGSSAGTRHMINSMLDEGKEVDVHIPQERRLLEV